MIESYYDPAMSGAITVCVFFACLLILFVMLSILFEPRKSKKYAELISDMYVVGIIKQLAEKDGVDLHKELLEFNKVMKRKELSQKGLSSVVEDELKEKIAKVQEENLEKSLPKK